MCFRSFHANDAAYVIKLEENKISSTEKDKIICRYGMLDGKHTVVIQNEEGMENAMVQMW